MRPDGEIVTVPPCLLKPEYKAPANVGWAKYHKPISQWDDPMWDWAIKTADTRRQQAQGG